LAIEHAKGGTLADIIKRRCGPINSNNRSSSFVGEDGSIQSNTLSDDECALIIRGILLGVKHIHSQDYVHRDLKPTNVVIDDLLNLETVKIVDFGLAIKVQSKNSLDETCGTLVYQAPE
jgi:serine/threonine protein kinase